MNFHAYVVSKDGMECYIGVTTRSVEKRWKYGHLQPGGKGRSALKEAIKKYGKEAFTITHIASAKNAVDLSELEKILVSQYNTIAPNGYNLTPGGFENIVSSKEVRKKIADANRGKKRTPEQCVRFSVAQMGKTMSLETRAKMSASRIGTHLKDETKAKLRAGRIGKSLSEEHKQKLSVSHLGKNTGPRCPCPSERRQAISDGHKKRRERRNKPETQGVLI